MFPYGSATMNRKRSSIATKKRSKASGKAARKDRLSLHPLDLETALAAALQTGPPLEPKKTGRATNKKR